tara:strand:- start:268 stop:396 length:129 start_codon:yes stop_codon:yes gene_type:complete
MSEDAEKRREAGEKAISRAIASCATWFISGKSREVCISSDMW